MDQRWIVWTVIAAVAPTQVVFAQQEHKAARRMNPAAPARQVPARQVPARRVPVRGWEGVSAHGFGVAEESARQDALERLARRIGRLRMSSFRRVEEFVASSPAIGEALRRRFAGVTFLPPQFTVDQICTVQARVAVADVIAQLKLLNRRYGDGRYRTRYFERIGRLNPVDMITALGQGVPSLRDVPRRGRRVIGATPSWSELLRREIGVGQAPASRRGTVAGKLIAAQRARNDARRNLAAYVRELPISTDRRTTVGSELDRRPVLAIRFQGWLGTAQVVRTDWDRRGEAVVEIEAHLRPLWDMVVQHRRPQPPVDARRTPVRKPREHKSRSPRRP